jgi:hypothetical protein
VQNRRIARYVDPDYLILAVLAANRAACRSGKTNFRS